MAKTRTRDRGFEAPTGGASDSLEAAHEISDKPAAVADPAASPPELAEETKPEAAASDTAPTVPATPVPMPAANISLEVFGRICGVKPDQFAGFAWFARRQALKPRPVASWREEFEQFLNRAVG